ncbi:FecR domain-containing protein [Paralimibaculum aggregatum]|uniref:FecR domain-containing protein n=1 Tax=Paralimibaculum aggregatum TaxID=3036245 RepID=UPI002557B715|nr:FecR domain-containing protein [Limibaculum sp. NKW23]
MKSVEGDVVIRRGGGAVAAIIGQSVFLYDELQTSAGGSVGIMLDDGTALAIGGASDVVLETFVFSPSDDLLDLVIRVLTGRLIYSSGKIGMARPEQVRIETPRLVVGTRGTRFAVIVPPAN